MMTHSNRIGFWPLLVCWAVTAAALVARAVLSAGSTPLILDSDDAMRLTEVHDFLGGQSWFDLGQHRLNTPYGGDMHWSRLIDLPEAGVLFVLRPVFGPLADTIAAYVWPLLLLALLLWVTARLAVRLGGRGALWPALVLPGFSLVTIAEFAPGRFDHHGVQIILTLVMVASSIAALTRPRFAIAAGLAAAAAITIGIEGLPIVLAVPLVLGLAWVAEPRHGVALRDFALSFALAATLGLAQGVPPSLWLTLRVDAISIVYVAFAWLAVIALVLITALPLRAWPARLVAGAVAGLAVSGGVVALDPAILGGPYAALDPWLAANWLASVDEAASWLASFAAEPVYPIAVTVPALTALSVALWNSVRNRTDRPAWLIYGGFLLVAIVVMLLQIRGARLALPLAVPADAALVAAAWRMQRRGGMGAILGFVGSAAASMGIVVAVIATAIVLAFPDYAAATSDRYGAARRACLMPAAFANLAGLPPERIMAPIDLGAHILLFTPHEVVGAPYHRNQQALIDDLNFFNEPIAAARRILEARGIGLVVICPAMREIRGMIAHAPDSFVSLFAAGKLPGWLVDQSLPGSPLKIYAVMPR